MILDHRELLILDGGLMDASTARNPFRFADSKDRIWDVTLTLAGANRIDSCDFSEIWDGDVCMLQPSEKFFTKIITSPRMIFAMVWCIVQPQAEAQNVSLEDWQESLDGPAISAAREAFWEALSDFFPDHKTTLSELIQMYRNVLKKADRKMKSVKDRIQTMLLDQVDKEVESVELEISKQLGEMSTK